MARHAPLELWTHVASLLDRLDLLSLACVSSIHLNASHRHLYRSLVLRIPKGLPTLLLLTKNDRKLAQRVLELEVHWYAGQNTSKIYTDVFLRALASMKHLRSLRIAGSYISPMFVEVLKNDCPALRQIVFDKDFTCCYTGAVQDSNMELIGIEKVEWRNSAGNNFAFIYSDKILTALPPRTRIRRHEQ